MCTRSRTLGCVNQVLAYFGFIFVKHGDWACLCTSTLVFKAIQILQNIVAKAFNVPGEINQRIPNFGGCGKLPPRLGRSSGDFVVIAHV